MQSSSEPQLQCSFTTGTGKKAAAISRKIDFYHFVTYNEIMDEILYDEITNSSNDDSKTDQSDYMEQKTWLVFKSDDAV